MLAMCMIASSGIITSANDGGAVLDGNAAVLEEDDEDTIVSGGAIVTDPGISVMSLLPLEEIDAEIDLTNMLPVELQNITVAELLSKMTNINTGEPIVIDDSVTTVWSKYINEYGNIDDDAWEKADFNDTFDLTNYSDNVSVEIIAGSGNQLDPGNIRYNTEILLPDKNAVRSFVLYSQNDNNGIISRNNIE